MCSTRTRVKQSTLREVYLHNVGSSLDPNPTRIFKSDPGSPPVRFPVWEDSLSTCPTSTGLCANHTQALGTAGSRAQSLPMSCTPWGSMDAGRHQETSWSTVESGGTSCGGRTPRSACTRDSKQETQEAGMGRNTRLGPASGARARVGGTVT